jgi:hypothetical protein
VICTGEKVDNTWLTITSVLPNKVGLPFSFSKLHLCLHFSLFSFFPLSPLNRWKTYTGAKWKVLFIPILDVDQIKVPSPLHEYKNNKQKGK